MTRLSGKFRRMLVQAGSRSVCRLTVVFLLSSGSLVVGQTLIDEDTVQTGGNVTTPGNGLLTITHPSNNPLLTLDGGAIRNSEAVVVGSASGESGRLRIQDGSTLNNTLGDPFQIVETIDGIDLFTGTGVIGLSPGSVGEATVTGAGSSWMTSDSLIVGHDGSGTLNVTGGGTVSSYFGAIGLEAGSSGSATISGVGSTWNSIALQVGIFGAGELTIEGGATVNTTDDIESTFGAIGFSGNGTVTITGAGSSWNLSDELMVGFESQGVLNIANGASFTSNEVYLGTGAFGNGKTTITGSGSTLNTDWILVGGVGSGELVIEDGGAVDSGWAIIGEFYNDIVSASGHALVSGSDSAWNISESLVVGGGGIGDLRIESGGSVSALAAVLAVESESSGTITVTGSKSTLAITDDLNVGVGDSATLRVSEGGLVQVGGVLAVHSAGILSGNSGILQGNVVNSGLVAPGNSTGQLTIEGNYTQESGGALEIELGGLLEGFLYDHLVVTGDANLSGDLIVSLTNGFELGLNQSFNILTVGGTLSGIFENLENQSLVGTFNGVDLFIDYTPTGPSAGVRLFTMVPEPSSLTLMLIGFGGAMSRFRRSKH